VISLGFRIEGKGRTLEQHRGVGSNRPSVGYRIGSVSDGFGIRCVQNQISLESDRFKIRKVHNQISLKSDRFRPGRFEIRKVRNQIGSESDRFEIR
jgi:hypothetical protein